MKTGKNSPRLGRNFLPFCAGIACGIGISVLLFLVFAIFGQVWFKTGQNFGMDVLPIERAINKPLLSKPGNGVMERKLSQDTGESEAELTGKRSIPIEAEPDPVPVEDSEWERNLSPAHIPGYLSQELKLKKKIFVAVVHPSTNGHSLLDIHQKTWAKDWVVLGNGDMTFYVPMGVDVAEGNAIKIQHLTATSQEQDRPSASMMYQVLNDICSQHIDTHHHFFITTSNTYVHLSKLLSFSNHLYDSESMWLGRKVANDDNERTYTNDPEYHCGLGTGFILTRHALQHLCPRLVICQRDYSDNSVSPGLQLSRCILRFLNETCVSPGQNLFHKTNSQELKSFQDNVKNPYENSISIYPVHSEVSFYKLHYFFVNQQLNQTKKSNEVFHNIIQTMDKVLVQEGGMSDDRLILGRNGNANKYRHSDIIAWDKIELDQAHPQILMAEGDEPSRDLTDSDKNVLEKVKAFALQEAQKEYGWTSDLTVPTIFRRVVPGVGFQYMVDVKWKNKEISTVYIDQPYDRMVPISTQLAPNIKVNFVLPLQDGSPHFKEFMQMFEQACMSADRAGGVALLVVLYFTPSENNSVIHTEKTSESLKLLNLYKQKYPDLSLRWINGGSDAFSSIQGISMAVRALPADTLICSTDVFVQMSPDFLHHARLNTIPGERLYYPAPFQQLESDIGGMHEVSKHTGFWRSFDYSLFCGYKQDIMRASGGEVISSGADLYEKALSSGLDVFRAPEHALMMRWEERDCLNSQLSKIEQMTCEETSKKLHLSASVLR